MPSQPLWDLYLLTYAYVLQVGYFLQVSQPEPLYVVTCFTLCIFCD